MRQGAKLAPLSYFEELDLLLVFHAFWSSLTLAVHPNGLGLLAVRGELGEAQVSTNDLVQASLRMRPDRIILGELRGPEAASFLRAVNTGHPGSITTVHADSPRGAVDQLSLLVMQSGLNMGRSEISEYVRGIVDVFVQLSRRAGRRTISQISFKGQS